MRSIKGKSDFMCEGKHIKSIFEFNFSLSACGGDGGSQWVTMLTAGELFAGKLLEMGHSSIDKSKEFLTYLVRVKSHFIYIPSSCIAHIFIKISSYDTSESERSEVKRLSVTFYWTISS